MDALESELRAIVEREDACKGLASIPGNGAITASATVAAIGDGRMFRSGRDFAAWLGLVPRQHLRTFDIARDKKAREHLHTHIARSWLALHSAILQIS